MRQDMRLLDEAVALARQEMDALEGGAFDRAVELARQRSAVTGMACQMFDESQREQYLVQLSTLARLQRRLTELATKARDDIRTRLMRSRGERRRMRGYQQSVEQALLQ